MRRDSKIPAEAEEIRARWVAWRKANGAKADDSATPAGQGVRNLTALQKREGLDWGTLSLAVERYLDHEADPEFPYKLANFFGRKAIYKHYAAADWTPPPARGGASREKALDEGNDYSWGSKGKGQ